MDVNLILPDHAVDYIGELCRMRRAALSKLGDGCGRGPVFKSVIEDELGNLSAVEKAIKG